MHGDAINHRKIRRGIGKRFVTAQRDRSNLAAPSDSSRAAPLLPKTSEAVPISPVFVHFRVTVVGVAWQLHFKPAGMRGTADHIGILGPSVAKYHFSKESVP